MSTIYTESAGGIIFNVDGKVAIVSQHGTTWSLPKGHVEEGEDLITAAHREILEETGIKTLKLIKKIGSYIRPRLEVNGNPNLTEIKTIHIYQFTTTEIDLCPSDPDNPEARWVNLLEVSTYLTHKKDKEFFNSFVENHTNS
ncbi:MAG: NUDIX domain-containing protein [Flavobacteriales bacterium]|nr:NUDIX domain-containing protein [Flavobacteriales bacterium]